ncbi:unnamed protein product [Soboliphyme baturini]|uniref:Receptor expression-enhancing protein n=1 Tax=Soboliphyme baturini TaxID=241478 RepID=A0A183IZ94_9BILA|nr:unnamed protein product [Soboliphyme baturini]
MLAIVENTKNEVKNYIYDDGHLASRGVAKIASYTRTSRENIAYAAMGIFAVYLIFGYFAELVCNFVGFAYPAVFSIQAIESMDKKDDAKWLTYWVVFSVCSLVDFGSRVIMRWFPVYWLCKCAFFLWLFLPWMNGVQVCYSRIIRPFSKKYSKLFETMEGTVAQ